MEKYVKPEVVILNDCAEGVYSASGSANGNPECDSIYMQGVFQNCDYRNGRTNKEVYGCLGCPAFRPNGCALLTEQAYLDGSSSYDVDKGNRKPEWERRNLEPNAPVGYW